MARALPRNPRAANVLESRAWSDLSIWRGLDDTALVELMIGIDDPRTDDVRALLAAHLRFANEHSPPEDVHALDVAGLLDPDVSFFSARLDGRLVGIGALKELDPNHGELKSMHTAQSDRGRGVGRAMVEHLLAVARDRGYGRVSLETGSMQAFAPAHALYASFGFVPCEPFAAYTDSPNSLCMTLLLVQRRRPSPQETQETHETQEMGTRTVSSAE
jgi:putative acetyltransferase